MEAPTCVTYLVGVVAFVLRGDEVYAINSPLPLSRRARDGSRSNARGLVQDSVRKDRTVAPASRASRNVRALRCRRSRLCESPCAPPENPRRGGIVNNMFGVEPRRKGRSSRRRRYFVSLTATWTGSGSEERLASRLHEPICASPRVNSP